MSEGRRGGEFFTPTSIVKLIVEIIEPFEGRIYDPACGSGGMFVQSAKFIKKNRLSPTKKISVYGQEKEEDTVKLSKMNLAVHGLGGDIKQGISYYEDLHESINKFDYAMANPPFNVSGVNKEKIKKDKRFFLGIPSNDNANYLWIQMIYSALNDKGKAGLVMANIASESRSSELEIRKKLILTKSIDVVISVRANFFYTVTNACTLWFFDKNKINDTRKNKILFIDAREIFEKIDSTHYEFSDEQIQFISNIIKLRKGHLFDKLNSNKLFKNLFPNKKYIDIKGLCRDVDISEIEKKDWSLNVGKYIELEREAVDENKVLNLEKIQNEIIEMDEESKKLTENLIKSINEINK